MSFLPSEMRSLPASTGSEGSGSAPSLSPPSLRPGNDRPIVAVVGFNLLTLFVFLTAPVAWDTDHVALLCLFVLVCQFAVFVGFRRGRAAGSAALGPVLPLSSGGPLTTRIFAAYAATFVVGYAYRMGFSPLDLAGMVDLLVAGVRDRRYGYLMSLRGTGLGPIPWTAYFLISVTNQLVFVVGFIQWQRLRRLQRWVFVAFVAIELFFWIGRGNAFGVVCMATTFYLAMMFGPGAGRLRVGGAIKNALVVIGLLVATTAFFAYNLYSRGGERQLQLTEFGHSPILLDHPAMFIVPESLLPSYFNVVSYMAGGYFHTSLAFDLEFRSTRMLGNNPAVINLASVAGIDVWEDTYMHRLTTKGVDEFSLWHSAYTWYASDVSFYGVPFLLFGIGYMFGFSWARARQDDFLSKIVFVIFGNMLLFLFANNTYLSSMFYSFMFLLPFWAATRLSTFGHRRHSHRDLDVHLVPRSGSAVS